MVKNELKICTKCKTPLVFSKFTKNKNTKDGLSCQCVVCQKEHKAIYHKKYPWKRTLICIKQRCNNKNLKQFKDYGGRGIKCLITSEELEKLWIRDEAHLMDRPSVDREENDHHYTFENCRYIELIKNITKDRLRPIIQLDLNGTIIKEWRSGVDAENALHIGRSLICACCRGKHKTTGGFTWKYKEKI